MEKPQQQIRYESGINGGQINNQGSQPVPEEPKERWRRHFRYTLSIREEKNIVRRFFTNLRVFLLDCWFDILSVLITIAVAAAVSHNIGWGSTDGGG